VIPSARICRNPRGRGARVRAFTLVELLIIVAIIGVLASLAIQSVRRYLSASKAAEAKTIVGQISRAAQGSFEREQMPAQGLPEGELSALAAHTLCATADPVPASAPAAKKYQPRTVDGADFNTGDPVTGWRCLSFYVVQPIYYQYNYTRGSSAVAPNNPAACSGACYEAAARGDLNGNSVFSAIARTGHVNTDTGELRVSTYLYVENEHE
jgi:type IV pilus assembly protein PilA